MRAITLGNRTRIRTLIQRLVVISPTAMACAVAASAQNGSVYFSPGNRAISRGVYGNNPNNVQVDETLPPNCAQTQAGCNGTTTYDGTGRASRK